MTKAEKGQDGALSSSVELSKALSQEDKEWQEE
jgi:hypothetical protein